MKRHNFFLPDDVVDELKAEAAKKRTTMSELIRQAIIAYLDGRRTNSDSATSA
jgi:metal-responsive CopG/Arc/MetJ family transcriptional regulator